MIIERTIQMDGLCLQMSIALTAAEQRKAYEDSQRSYRLEDISNHLHDMDEEDLSGYTAEEVADNLNLMDEILQSFFKHQDCEQAENDVMNACIRTILAEQARRDRKAAI